MNNHKPYATLILPSNLPSDWFLAYQATNSTRSAENALSIDSDAKYDEARSVCFLGIMMGGRGAPQKNFGVCLLRTCVHLSRTRIVRHWRTKKVFLARTVFVPEILPASSWSLRALAIVLMSWTISGLFYIRISQSWFELCKMLILFNSIFMLYRECCLHSFLL